MLRECGEYGAVRPRRLAEVQLCVDRNINQNGCFLEVVEDAVARLFIYRLVQNDVVRGVVVDFLNGIAEVVGVVTCNRGAPNETSNGDRGSSRAYHCRFIRQWLTISEQPKGTSVITGIFNLYNNTQINTL